MHTRTLVLGVVLATALSGAAALASADAATSHHATRAAKAGAYSVSVAVNKTEPLLNSRVKIKGSVSPAAPGAAVTLQVKYEDRKSWKTIDQSRLNAASKFKFKDKVGSVRDRRYRVVKPAGPSRGAGRAATQKVIVFGWRDLTSLTPATGYGVSIDYNLNRECKAFKGTAGLDDSSPAAGSAVVTLTADGTLKYAGSFALTQSAPVAFDLTKVFRLSVSVAQNSGGLGAVGTPQVLCSF
jgi:hypothetical protein